MVFQLASYLAKKGLDLITEGEAQTLEWYIHKDQRQQSLKWITELMIKHQKAFEAADDALYGESTGGTTPADNENQQQNSSQRSAPVMGGVKKPHRYRPGTVAL